MTKKIITIAFRSTKTEKEELKKFADRDFQTMGGYIRKTINFYELNKNKVVQ